MGEIIHILDYFETCANCLHYTDGDCGVPGGFEPVFIKRPGLPADVKCRWFERRANP